MNVYRIEGTPVAWTSHRGYGKKSFNPRFKEKKAAQWELSVQHNGRPLYERAVRVDFLFQMPIPKSLPKAIQKRIAAGEKVYHDKRPDATNLRKFAEDCLTSVVILDDNIVVTGITEKIYATVPCTLMTITPFYE